MCVHRKHWLQECVREAGKQLLKMIPGPCAVVNPENNCPDYRRRLSARLAAALGLRRRGNVPRCQPRRSISKPLRKSPALWSTGSSFPQRCKRPCPVRPHPGTAAREHGSEADFRGCGAEMHTA